MHWKGGRYPPPLQGAQPMPSPYHNALPSAPPTHAPVCLPFTHLKESPRAVVPECAGLGPRDALQGKGPQRWPERRLDRRLEEVAKAVPVGYKRR